jgi:putative ABC transport system substrate-binding protein
VKRRVFISLLGGAATWPLAARAQSKPARIALLGSGAAQSSGIFVDALKQGLADNGLIEGQGYVLDIRWAEGEYERFPALAAEVASRNPNIILATTIAAVRSAQRASVTIPIVMTTINDPVGAGLIASLARPGGNTTGIANLSEGLAQKPVDALMVAPGPLFNNRRVQLITLAAYHRVPAIYFQREAVEAGGLMSYGTRLTDVYRQSGVYTGRILKGEKPAELPVLQPTKFEFVINLNTAKAFGLSFPPSLLAIADEVIE